MQGGDIVDGTGKGDPNFTLADESYGVKHDQPGILGMALVDNKPNTANSQFYITLAPIPSLDKRRVAFGRVIPESLPAFLSAMREIKLTGNERPIPELVIASCKMI
jgi:cyclophilin family peptidyl-prolyl cis-trans isomerase